MSRLYIRVKTGFYSHRKTARLRSVIGDDAFWIPPRLWAYCAENQPDGNLESYQSAEIAELVGCQKYATSILQALKDAGFLDQNGMVHDWAEHNGYHETFSKRAKNAAAARWSKENTPTPPKEQETGKWKVESGDKHCIKHPQAMLEASNKQTSTGPSLDEVVAHAELVGYPKAESEKFWHHFEASGWIDKNGHPVKKWQSKLATWSTTVRAAGPERAHRASETNGRPKTPMDLKTIIQAKEVLAGSIRKKHCSDVAMGDSWNDDKKRHEYFQLKKDIRILNEQISSMA